MLETDKIHFPVLYDFKNIKIHFKTKPKNIGSVILEQKPVQIGLVYVRFDFFGFRFVKPNRSVF